MIYMHYFLNTPNTMRAFLEIIIITRLTLTSNHVNCLWMNMLSLSLYRLTNIQKGLDHTVQHHILELWRASKLLSPALIILCSRMIVLIGSNWVCSFNKTLVPKIYPLPIIRDILECILGYTFFTKWETYMNNCTFECNEKIQDLWIIIMPFGDKVGLSIFLLYSRLLNLLQPMYGKWH